jgi:site-specific DNA-methyltransferase (adenine-specific)
MVSQLIASPTTPFYQQGDSTLYLGDCTEILRAIPDHSVDAIITDPPYAIPTVVASGRTMTRNAGDLSLIEATFRSLFDEFGRILKPTGRFFVFCDGTSYPVVFRAAYGRFSSALLVWNKGRIGMGREFRKSHELILHCWQSGTPVFTDGVGRPDVMTFAPVAGLKLHDAQKPVDLIEHLLTVCGDVILDPFSGSASTGVACQNTQRQFIGIEIDERNCSIAAQRLAAPLN